MIRTQEMIIFLIVIICLFLDGLCIYFYSKDILINIKNKLKRSD